MLNKLLLLTFFACSSFWGLNAQCFQVADGNGVMSNNPYFISCTPGNFTVFIQTDQTIGPYVIDWGDGSANSTGATLVPPAVVQHTYATATDTFNIVITENGTGCVVNGVAVLERNPLASIQLPAGDDNFGCTPVQFRFVNSSTQISQTTTFTWDFGDGSPIQVFDYTNLGDTVYHTYLPGVGVQSCNLEVRLTATNYCGNSTASFFPLRVWDLDEARITPSATLLCYPDTTVTYTNNTIRNCFPEGNQSQRYEYWNFGDYWGLGRDSIIDWRPWNPPIINPPPIGYPGIGTYTVMLIDSSFCGKDTTFESITITAPPSAGVSLSRDTICEGERVRIFNNSIGAANAFFWDYGQGANFVQRSGNNKNVRFNNSGDFSIGLAIGINGAPSCVDTAKVDLYVNPAPDSDFSFSPNNQCDSATVSFSNTSSGNIVRWDWDFGNGNVFSGQNPSPQFYASPGSYTVKLLTENNQGCLDSITRVLTVRETPVANFSVNSVCLNQIAQFNDLSTATLDPISSWKWYFGDGDSSIVQNPTHLYTNFGTYQVVLLVDNGFCQDSDTLDVTVEPNPTAAFTPSVDSGCSRLTVQFSNTSSSNATNLLWDFGDGTSLSSLGDTAHTFTNGGINDTAFVVRLIAQTAFGCSDTTYDTITVFPIPVPSFTSDAVLDCGPVTVNFTNTTVGSGLDYFWDFGDGSPVVNDTNPTHVFQNQTLFINNYNVSLVVVSAGGCRDTSSQVIPIYPEPQFTFQVVPDSGCSPLSVTFPAVVGAVDYNWDFGDGTTGVGPSPTHLYVNNTTNDLVYNVRLIAQNSFGCLDTTFGSVTVFPSPIAQFTLDTTIGCQPFPLTITNNSVAATSFDWNFDDGTVSDTAAAVFVKTFTNTSAITQFNDISLITTTTKGCKDTATARIQVHPFLQASFISDSVGCSPTSINYLNTSIGASQFIWSFGDGDSSVSPNTSHLFINPTFNDTNYRSVLTAVSPQGCVDSIQKNILIYPKPVADFVVSDTLGCQPLLVNITNNSLAADSCFWSYGDGNTFDQCVLNSQHTYTNTTSFTPIRNNLRLFVFTDNGCRDTAQQFIEVNPQVIADFNAIDSACSPVSVNYQNRSVGGQSYNWTFGNGGNSFNPNPNQSLVNPGDNDTTYISKLVVTSAYQCQDSISKSIKVFAKPRAILTLDTNRGCHPLTVNFSNGSINADSCRWVFGDGMVEDSCYINYSKVFDNLVSSATVSYNTRLFIFSDKGCRDTVNQNVTVNPNIKADFTVNDSACTPYNASFINQSVGVDNYTWQFGDGASSLNASPNHFYINNTVNDTVFRAQLTVSNQFGCEDTASQLVVVHPKPIADYSVDNNDGCHPLPVQFTNQSVLDDFCQWDFDDGTTSDSCGPVLNHTYTNQLSVVPISYFPNLIVSTVYGCSDTLSRQITVNPEVIADFTSDTVGCSPLATTLRSQSTGASNYTWDFGDGATGSGIIAGHTFTNTTPTDVTYNVTLTAQSIYGCDDQVTKGVTVLATPIPNFTPSPVFQVFPSATVFFANGTSAGNWSYSWDFGDSTFSSFGNPGSHTYQSWGTYDITLTASGAVCSDEITKSIEIDVPIPVVEFSDSASGCSPLEVSFINETLYGAEFEWDFGDGGTSTAENPTYTYLREGEYNVTLRVRGFAPNKEAVLTKSAYIKVFKSPSAGFFVNKDKVFIPNDPLVMFNTSVDADLYQWDFGDGNSSNEESPVHFYREEGEFQIRLIAQSLNNCADTFFLPNLVLAELKGSVIVPNAFTPNPNGSSGGRVNPFAGLDQLNDVFYAKVEGTINYELNIFNKWGELLFVSTDPTIGWDGYYKGKLCQQDAYVWKVTAEFADGNTVVKTGDLMLLR